MKESRLYISFVLIMKLLLRRRMVPVLMVVIPAAFFLVVYLTTSTRVIPFRVASMAEDIFIEVGERSCSLAFFAVASVGFLSSYVGLILIQSNVAVNHRLIICGYHPLEILLSHFIVLFMIILFVAAYTSLSLLIFFSPSQFILFFLSLILAGWVYGSYGLAIGSLIKGELEGILMIVLLANIDAGWLQNPLFYAEAENQVIIRYLPAYFPSQAAIISAFSTYDVINVVLGSLIYGSLFFILANAMFYSKMKKV
ncbi:ABC transporter permease [Labilibacter sediminis]|nr:ABC transporter permease [Labilibacter sediminis]